jgi:hypothetical protein
MEMTYDQTFPNLSSQHHTKPHLCKYAHRRAVNNRFGVDHLEIGCFMHNSQPLPLIHVRPNGMPLYATTFGMDARHDLYQIIAHRNLS